MTAPVITVIDGGYVLAAVWTNDDRPTVRRLRREAKA
jgi:hypothetical protein